ncbi:MAG: hypothetical protein JO264_06460 [Acidisphaera sp.]|nr:hypothetical protein [Acidisphaera sp.]
MSNLEDERRHLAQAEADIVDGERRVSAQELLIEQLRRGGHETREAEVLMLTLRQTLDVWRGHRGSILQEIARLERARG